jgi:hypothetical protein
MVSAIHTMNVCVKEPTYSNTDTAIGWTKDKTKDFLKLIRDTFRWIGHYSVYAGHNASVAFGVGDRFASAVSLFGFKSFLEDVVKMSRAKSKLDFTDQTALAAIHGSGSLKVLHQMNVIDTGAATPYLGPVANAATVLSSGISTYKANNEIAQAQKDSEKVTSANEKSFFATYQNERRATIVQNVAVVAIGVFGLAAAAAMYEACAITMLACSSVAIMAGIVKYNLTKCSEYNWKKLRYDAPNAQLLTDAKYHPSAWKNAIA